MRFFILIMRGEKKVLIHTPILHDQNEDNNPSPYHHQLSVKLLQEGRPIHFIITLGQSTTKRKTIHPQNHIAPEEGDSKPKSS
ncbi:unnamed protein product [Cochlearia groenlandica]